MVGRCLIQRDKVSACPGLITALPDLNNQAGCNLVGTGLQGMVDRLAIVVGGARAVAAR